MEKIKILQINDNLAVSSGVSSVIMNYYRNISKEKLDFEFLIVNNRNEEYENCLQNDGVKLFYLKNKITPLNYWKNFKEIDEFFKKNSYDIVELHTPNYAFLFMPIAKKYGVEVRILHTHSSIFSTSIIKSIVGKILNWNMKRYINIPFACSDLSAKYWYGEKWFKEKKGFIIPNVIDQNNYIELTDNQKLKLKQSLGINLHKKIVGTVSRISKDKNIPFLLKIVDSICKTDKDIIFLIVGDGKLLKKAKKYVKKKKIENNVVFTGYRKDVYNLLQIMDVYILTSKKEGLPMTVVEAQQANIPCLVSNTITRQVNINNVEFEKIRINCWKNKIIDMAYKEYDGEKKQDSMFFNIKRAAKNLEKIYIELYKLSK